MEQHVEHAHGFADVIVEQCGSPSSILDLGSGGGIPGLVLSERFPMSTVTLLDGRAGRVDFLYEVLEELNRGQRLQLVGDRAERFAQRSNARHAYEVVVARGFARPAATVECAAPLLVRGGTLIVSEPPTSVEDRWDVKVLASLGLELGYTHARTFRYAVLTMTGTCPAAYPRRVGLPEKRPLF